MNSSENKLEYSIGVRNQYLKDISFENPQAPEIFTKNIKPEVDISVDIKANIKNGNTYEVILYLKVIYQFESKIIFMIETEYGGVFDLSKIEKKDLEFVTLVECPKILFPYLRQIVSNLTSYGGYPSVLIEPIDFNSIFIQHKNKQ